MPDPSPGADPFLTTSEAAGLLDVSVATLRRWATLGLLPSERTPGGHRRFRRLELERLVRRPSTEEAGRRWVELLLEPDGTLALQAALHASRSALGSWWAVVEEFFPGILELYRRAEGGELTQLQLLAGFEQLGRALSHFDAHLPRRPDGPTLLLAALPGDRLLHPLRATSLCAAEAGWRPRWAGLATAEELRADLARARPDALVVSASVRTDPARAAAEAGPYCALARDAALPTFLAGAWPEVEDPALQVGSYRELASWLAARRPPPRAPPAGRRESPPESPTA